MIAPVVTLKLLGGFAMERGGAPLAGRAAQRRRLALLGLLAAAPNGTVSRDRLIGLLWPEADSESARGLLNTAVYDLRQALGQLSIRSLGDDLSLNRETVRSDVAEFESALGAGDAARAVALYHGPFLDGFFVSDAPEFERWLEGARDRLGRLYRQALERLADAAPGVQEVAELRLRVATEAPTDAAAVCRAIKALAEAGDRAAALRLADRYLEMTGDIGPDASVLALAGQMRTAFIAPASDAEPAAPSRKLARVRPLERQPPRRRRATLALAGAGIVTLAMLGSRVLPPALGGNPLAAEPAVTSVRIAQFSVQGDSSLAHLGHDIPALLQTALDGVADLRVLPDSADPGAGLRITGSAYGAPGSLRLRASLLDGTSRTPLAVATAEGPTNQLFRLIDQLAVQLLAGRPGPPRERLGRVAAGTTTSMRALRHYLAGEGHYRAGRYLAAVEQYRQAVQHDTAFALAHYRLSSSVLAADLPEAEATAADAKAERFGAGLSDRDRILLRAYGAFRAGVFHTASRLYRSLVALYPDDLEAWQQLGETLFHYNPRGGRTIHEAREAFERVLALDPAHWSARWHLAHLAAEGGDANGFLTHTASLLDESTEDAPALEIQTLRALAAHDRSAERALLARLASTDELRLFQIAWRSAVFLDDLAAADRVIELLGRGTGLAPLLAGATRAELSIARGRWDDARSQLTSLQHAENRVVLEARLLDALHPYAPDRQRSLASLRVAVGRIESGSEAGFTRALALGYAASVLGDSAGAMAMARVADSLGGSPRAGNGIRAHLALGRGRLEDAATLSWADTVPWFGLAVTSPVRAGTVERWIHAEALRGLGRDSAALGWYGSFGEHALPDVTLLAPARLRRGEIFEKLGRREEAVREYRAFLELWRESDPELQGMVEDVRRRVARVLAGAPPGR